MLRRIFRGKPWYIWLSFIALWGMTMYAWWLAVTFIFFRSKAKRQGDGFNGLTLWLKAVSYVTISFFLPLGFFSLLSYRLGGWGANAVIALALLIMYVLGVFATYRLGKSTKETRERL